MRAIVRGGQPGEGGLDEGQGLAVMVAVVSETHHLLYHETLARLGGVERRYGRRAAHHDLLLAYLAEQERREVQAEMAKAGGKK